MDNFDTIKTTGHVSDNRPDLMPDEQLLQRFFSEHTAEIADEGFSAQVMQQLPQRARRLNRVWTAVCVAATALVFLYFDGMAALRVLGTNFLGDLAGYLSAMYTATYPLLLLPATLAVLGTVSVYNLLANQR